MSVSRSLAMKMLVRFVVFAAVAPAGYSQSMLYKFHGDSVGDYLAYSVSDAGDVNGDGYPDLIVGIPHDDPHDPHGADTGSARVFSGMDGSILYTFDGDSPKDLFGYSVSGAGDVNADGFADLIVGAWLDDNNGWDSGSARVFSGIDGSVLYTFDGDSSNVWFGKSVSGAGDVNGDGYDDLIVGASINNPGIARVFSGLDGSVLYTFNGNHDSLGYSVSDAGDVNGDGYADLIVGVPGASPNGSRSGNARVFSGVDGSILYSFDGDATLDWFGYSVSGAGDVNGDGFADLIVGATSGFARVFSGFDGSVLYTFQGVSGYSVSDAGDVNGDGYADVIARAPGDKNGPNSGSAHVFSGVDGSILYILDGEFPYDEFGHSVSGAGDVNGDGFDDLIVGTRDHKFYGNDSGIAYVFSGCDALGTNYCTPAVHNSSGQSAVISACGSDLSDGGYFMLHAKDLPPDRFGYFIASQTQNFVANPGGSQGNLCLGGNISRFVKQVLGSGSDGSFALNVPTWAIPGETWNFQAWFRDKNPGPTSNFTDAVSVLFK